MTELTETSTKKKSSVLIGAIVALIVIIAVIVYLILTKQTATAPTSNNISATSTNTTPGVSNLNTTNTNSSNVANTTNTTSNTTSNATNTTSTTVNTATPKTVEIDLTGTSFQFSKKEITVNQNDKVTIKFTSEGGEHSFVLDGYNLMTQTVGTGETSSVSFTADKKGSFDFYCGVANHRDKGMEGKLIVQ